MANRELTPMWQSSRRRLHLREILLSLAEDLLQELRGDESRTGQPQVDYGKGRRVTMLRMEDTYGVG